MVYEKFSIPIHIGSSIKPIIDFNNPAEVGKLILLKRRNDKSSRPYTHVAIYIGNHRVIHNTFYLGKMVVISTIEEILVVYKFA